MTLRSFVNLAGGRFGRLVVLELELPCHPKGVRWICRCDCGTVRRVHSRCLRVGETKSCGCLHRELLSKRSKTHGNSLDPTYTAWAGMHRRCSDQRMARYGGRGIRVCDEWSDFETFRQWSYASGYAKGLSLDRVNNDGNYSPDNCRWATRKTQSRNKCTNVLLTLDGVTKPLVDWATAQGISDITIRGRLRRGWDVRRALTLQPQKSVGVSP